jgi:hypothetical protein
VTMKAPVPTPRSSTRAPAHQQPNRRSLALLHKAAAPDLAETTLPPIPKPRSAPKLRRYKFFAATALLVAGALGVIGCVQLRDDLTSGQQPLAQAARLGAVEHELITARNLTARQLLEPSANTGQAATDSLSSASSQLTAAVAAQPSATTAFSAINSDLLSYSSQLEAAATATTPSASAAALTSADAILDQSLSPKLEALRQAQSATPAWSVGIWLAVAGGVIALATLIWVSIATARLSHRYVNGGLAVAAVCAIVITGISGAAIAQVNAAATASSKSLQKLNQVDQARLSLDKVNRLLLRGALNHSWTDEESAEVTALSGRASSAAAAVSAASTSDIFKIVVADAVDQISSANDDLRWSAWSDARSRLEAKGQVSYGVSSAAEYGEAAATTEVALAGLAANGTADTMTFGAGVAGTLALFGAALCVQGLNKRLSEYR